MTTASEWTNDSWATYTHGTGQRYVNFDYDFVYVAAQ